MPCQSTCSCRVVYSSALRALQSMDCISDMAWYGMARRVPSWRVPSWRVPSWRCRCCELLGMNNEKFLLMENYCSLVGACRCRADFVISIRSHRTEQRSNTGKRPCSSHAHAYSYQRSVAESEREREKLCVHLTDMTLMYSCMPFAVPAFTHRSSCGMHRAACHLGCTQGSQISMKAYS
jgi:hypothetical protein